MLKCRIVPNKDVNESFFFFVFLPVNADDFREIILCCLKRNINGDTNFKKNEI